MLEYILMNIGQKSLRNLLESLVVSNKELSVLKSISDILAETLGLKLTYDDSLGKYTIRESLYNSKISIKPELAALMSSMSKGNLDTETELYQNLLNSIGYQYGIKLNINNIERNRLVGGNILRKSRKIKD